jgi:hypothetical protein
MSDGIQALRAIVGPFAAPAQEQVDESAASTSDSDGSQRDSEAAAPFQKS